MKRSLMITGGIALFAGTAALAALVADSTQDELRAVLPAPFDEAAAIQVVSAAQLASPDAAGVVVPLTEEELGESGGTAPGAEYLPLAEPSTPVGSDAEGAEAQSLDLDTAFAPEVGAYALRFQDLCAGDPAAVGCPIGIGGTILPLSDPVYPPFDLIAISEVAIEFGWGCPDDDPGSGQYLIGLPANHPARIEVRYWPVDAPAEVRTAVVDQTAPDSFFLSDFMDVYDSPTPPSSYVLSHCTYLDIDLGGAYVVEAHATSFTGEVDDLTEVLDVPLQRPPVIVIPRGNYQLNVGVPVSSEPRLVSKVRLFDIDAEGSCFDTTTDTALGDELVTPPATGRFERRDSTYGERSIRSPYDLSYDSLDLWSFDLKEGSFYFMCVWWLEVPDGASGLADAQVVAAESRLITTPNMTRTVLSAAFMFAGVDGPDIDADSYRVRVEGPCESSDEVAVPPDPIGAGTGTWEGGDIALCTHTGVEGPSTTRLHVERPDGVVKTFLIPTPNTSVDYQELLSLYLGDDPECGSAWDIDVAGPCWGPRLTVRVSHLNEWIGASEWAVESPESVDLPTT